MNQNPNFRTVALLLLLCQLAASAAADEPISRAQQVLRIDVAVDRAASFLIAQQQPDGTWRSRTYGLLKDGTSLTPLVLLSLPKSKVTQDSRERGLKVLASWLDPATDPAAVRQVPQYPVYTAGLVLGVLRADRNHDFKMASPWKKILVAHQLTEANGWTRDDDRFGGWGYSHDPPRRPEAPMPLSPLDEPNLSATVFALEGLGSDVPEDQTNDLRKNALRFVGRCQNWRETAPEADAQFNDGGFHFMLDDEVRNKPGLAGIDSAGQMRFRSYGSSTADGLRALLLCGLKADHPRVAAAQTWLLDHLADGAHPGAYPSDRTHLRPSLDFYYTASAALAFRRLRTARPSAEEGNWAFLLAHRLLEQQKADGSWQNTAVDVREDDPLIATSFAIQALRSCRDELK